MLMHADLEAFRHQPRNSYCQLACATLGEGIAQLAAARPYWPDGHEMGLGHYRHGATYLVNGEDGRVSFSRLRGDHDPQDLDLHVHAGQQSAKSRHFFPSPFDFEYHADEPAPVKLILSPGAAPLITRYSFPTAFRCGDTGLYVPAGANPVRLIHGYNPQWQPLVYTEQPVEEPRSAAKGEKDGATIFEVLTLPVLMLLHERYGDDLFYDSRLDWYEEAKHLIG